MTLEYSDRKGAAFEPFPFDPGRGREAMPIQCRLIEHIGEESVLFKRLPEWIAAVFILAFGVQLLRPESSFDTAKVYTLLAQMASEKTWGIISVSIGVLQLASLLLNGFYPYVRRATPVMRALSLFLGGSIWLAIASGLIRYNTNIPTIVAHVGWATLNFIYSTIVAHEAAASLRRGFKRYADRRT